jgi:hypothetical protein
VFRLKDQADRPVDGAQGFAKAELADNQFGAVLSVPGTSRPMERHFRPAILAPDVIQDGHNNNCFTSFARLARQKQPTQKQPIVDKTSDSPII